MTTFSFPAVIVVLSLRGPERGFRGKGAQARVGPVESEVRFLLPYNRRPQLERGSSKGSVFVVRLKREEATKGKSNLNTKGASIA